MELDDLQDDIRNGMKLEDALIKHNLTLKDAFDMVHKPLTVKTRKKPYRRPNVYKHIEKSISRKGDAYHVRKHINGKTVWGGAYSSLEDARLVRDFLDEHGWNIVKVNEACKKYGIERRRK